MSTMLPPVELRRKGMDVLVRELGYAEAIRFIHQFDLGRGDYTGERHAMLPPMTIEQIAAESDRIVRERDRGAAGQ